MTITQGHIDDWRGVVERLWNNYGRINAENLDADQKIIYDEIDDELGRAQDDLDAAQEALDQGDTDTALKKLKEALEHLEKAVEKLRELQGE